MQTIMKNEKIKVLYVGAYNLDYSRNVILRRGLRQNDVEVIECQISSTVSKIKQFSELLLKLYRLKFRADVVIVSEMAHRFMPIMFIYGKIKRVLVIFDPFVSQYDSIVFDRKKVLPKSLKAKYYYLIDKLSMQLSDVLLADTIEHKNFYRDFFNIKKDIFILPVGADEEVFVQRIGKSGKEIPDKFNITFWGTFIPLQGIQYILAAAELLISEKAISFNLIGDGQVFAEMKRLAGEMKLTNVNFFGQVELNRLPDFMRLADISLGIFGDTNKAKRVVPNKVYSSLAMGVPVITGDSLAIREMPDYREYLYLVNMADGKSLANKIMQVYKNRAELERIGANGLSFFKKHLTSQMLGLRLKDVMTAAMSGCRGGIRREYYDITLEREHNL